MPEAKPKEANQPPKKAPQAPSAGQGSGEKKIPKSVLLHVLVKPLAEIPEMAAERVDEAEVAVYAT